MSAEFTFSELRLLLETAFRLEGEDPDALARVAVKACLSARVPMAALLWQIFDVESNQAFPLKRLFRTLSRFNELDALAPLVDHPSAEVRGAVIHACYNFGLPADAACLGTLLSDEDPHVRRRAAEAIEVILDPVNRPRPRETLDGVLNDQEELIARIVLGRLDDSDVRRVARLLHATSPGIRQLARTALQATTECSATVLLDILEAISAAGGSLSREAIGAAQDVADDRAVGLLIRALRQPENDGQIAAADALRALGSRAAVPLLDAFERDSAIRRRWGTLVAQVAGPAALGPLLASLESPYASVRLSGAEGLRELGASALPALVARLTRADADDCATIIGILGRSGAAEALEPILERTSAPDPVIRIAALRALASFDTSEATRALASAAGSPNWQVRRAVMETLGHRLWSNHDVARILGDAVHDANPQVRAAAADSLDRVAGGFSMDDIDLAVELLSGDDEKERARAHATVEALRGVISFSKTHLRVSSPEGEAHRNRIERALRTHFDLTAFDAAARKRVEMRTAADRMPDRPSAHPSITDNVRFSVLSPLCVIPGKPCLIDVWVHPGDLDAVLHDLRRNSQGPWGVGVRSKGPVEVTRGTALVASLMVPSLGWADEDLVQWTGVAGNATYGFEVPAGAEHGEHAGQLQVHVGGVQLARVAFLISVGSGDASVHDVTVSQRVVSSAFASYATEDRDDVLARIQGMLQVAPHLEIFLDVVSLRSGDRWEERLKSEILERDVLYLFWSRAARASRWVDNEWRTAYRARGLDGVEPVPLEPPDVSPPPPELSGLHFGDWTLQIRRHPEP